MNEDKIIDLLANLAAGQQEMRKAIGGMQDAIDGLTSDMAGLGKRMDGVESRLDGMESRLDKMDSRLDRMEKTQKTMQQEQKAMRKDISEARAIAERVEDRVNNYDAEAVLSAVQVAAARAEARAEATEMNAAKLDALTHEVARIQGAMKNAGAALLTVDRKPA